MPEQEKKFDGYIIAKEGYKPLIVSGEALKKLAKKGKLRSDDLVFCDFQKVWKKGGNFSLNINQGSLSNWSAGGDEFSFSLNTYLNLYAFYKKNRNSWDNTIDLAFGISEMEGLTAEEVKKYIRYIADRRLISLGLKGIFKVKKNPLPWVEEMINAPTHTNFFENRATDYAKGATKGDWADVWGKAA